MGLIVVGVESSTGATALQRTWNEAALLSDDRVLPTETTASEDDWRGYRVFGPDGFLGTVEECVRALAGGPDELRIRSGLFVPFRQVVQVGDVDRISHPARRLALRSCATLDPASEKDPR
jgi:hypothetical protein